MARERGDSGNALAPTADEIAQKSCDEIVARISNPEIIFSGYHSIRGKKVFVIITNTVVQTKRKDLLLRNYFPEIEDPLWITQDSPVGKSILPMVRQQAAIT